MATTSTSSLKPDGHGLVAVSLVARDQVDDLRFDEDLAQVDELHVGGRRNRARDVFLGDETEGDERLDDADTVRGGVFACFEHLGRGDHASVL